MESTAFKASLIRTLVPVSMLLVDHLGVEPRSTSLSETVILRDLLCSLYSFGPLAELLPAEVLVVSRFSLAQASQGTLLDCCTRSSVQA